MQLTLLSAVIIAFVFFVALAWRVQVRRPNRATPEARYRNDIQHLKRRRRTPVTGPSSDDIWSAGAAQDSPHSRSTKTTTWATIAVTGGCGGCGGCGCGG